VSLVVGFRVWQVSIGFGQFFAEFFSGSLSGIGTLKIVFFKILEIEIIDDKSGWHNVALVNILNESFDSSLFNEFLLIDSSLDISGISGNSDY
jgi:hypothetical protein